MRAGLTLIELLVIGACLVAGVVFLIDPFTGHSAHHVAKQVYGAVHVGQPEGEALATMVRTHFRRGILVARADKARQPAWAGVSVKPQGDGWAIGFQGAPKLDRTFASDAPCATFVGELHGFQHMAYRLSDKADFELTVGPDGHIKALEPLHLHSLN